ncbi:MAG: tetratricopeptide repeat protein [Nitrospinota bacterium]|nr:tetratricopeptide repeat protein [Nitrospinota bacterium]
MQNPRKVLLATAVLMVLHASPGWSESSLNQKQNENQNEIIKLKEKIERDYMDIKSINDLGVIYLKQEKYDQAIDQFKKALEVDPGYTMGPFFFGDVYTDEKNYQDKINEFKDVIKINREYARAHNYLGLTHLKKKSYSSAETSLLESIKINPKYAKAHNNLGVLYEEMGDTAKAIESYRMAQKLDPNDPDSLYNLGLAYNSLEDGENSVRYMVQAKKAHEKKFGQEGIDQITEKLNQLSKKYADNNEVESIASLSLSSDDNAGSPSQTDINQTSIVSPLIPLQNLSQTPSTKSSSISKQKSGVLTVNLKPQIDMSSRTVSPLMENQMDQNEPIKERIIATYYEPEQTASSTSIVDPIQKEVKETSDKDTVISSDVPTDMSWSTKSLPVTKALNRAEKPNELIADAKIEETTITEQIGSSTPDILSSESEEETEVVSSLSLNPKKKVIAHKKEKKTWASDWVFEYPK